MTCFVSQRICPGKHLAVTSIVSAMSTCATLLSSRLVLTTVQTLNAMNFLWAFNFLPAKDPHTGERKKIDLNDAEDVRPFSSPEPDSSVSSSSYSQGLFLKLRPFDCEIVPRSSEKAEMIRTQCAAAKSTFDLFDHRVPTTTQ